jgi:hypothetical protein
MSLAEAITSYERAIAVLRVLPTDREPIFSRNLAAMWMNHGRTLLHAGMPPERAASSARNALALIFENETNDADSAEVGLKARIVLCQSLSELLVTAVSTEPTAAWRSEADETVDRGLEIFCLWENRGWRGLRPWHRHLFYFGAHFHRTHQPHFLAEFLLENLDWEQSSKAVAVTADLLTTAVDVLPAALAEAGNRALTEMGTAAAERRVQTLRDLRLAQERLAFLHSQLALPATGGSI